MFQHLLVYAPIPSVRYTLWGIFCIFFLGMGCKSQVQQGNTPHNKVWAQKAPYVVMVSADGFRHDYRQLYPTPNLDRIASEGLAAEAMLASFPSSTFPNHYTLATGLYPSRHGIVNNTFYDPGRKEMYMIRDRAKIEDGTFYGGTPLWVLAEQAGMRSATFFWVGSEADVKGTRPSYYYRYDGKIPNQRRVDQAIEWLQLPEAERPHLVMLYFSIVDSRGHRYGPQSDEVQAAVVEVDTLVGQLDRRLQELNIPVNLIVTSDHGMVEVNKEVSILPERMADLSEFTIAKGSALWMLHTDNQAVIQPTYERLKENTGPHLQVYLKEDIPAHLHFRGHERIGDIVLISDPPYMITSWGFPKSTGAHGFDPKSEDMKTIFLAKGPNITAGTSMPPFENVHVYPLVASLLGLKVPKDIDGSRKTWKPYLK